MSNCFRFGYEDIRGGSAASCDQFCRCGGKTPAGGWLIPLGESRGAKDERISKVAMCFGFFVSIFGILLIAGGVVVGYKSKKLDPILFYVEDVTQHKFLPSYQLMITIGIFLCLAAICACFNVFFKIAVSCFLLAFIIIIVLVGCLSHSVSKFDSGTAESDIKTNMMAKINSFNFKSSDSILNYIQQKLKCCGVQKPSDWQNNNNFKRETFPDSCCKNETPDCGQNYKADKKFQDGCLNNLVDKIRMYFRWQMIFLIFFCLIAAFIICFCCCIVCRC